MLDRGTTYSCAKMLVVCEVHYQRKDWDSYIEIEWNLNHPFRNSMAQGNSLKPDILAAFHSVEAQTILHVSYNNICVVDGDSSLGRG